jgi:transcription antitermination factor NusG
MAPVLTGRSFVLDTINATLVSQGAGISMSQSSGENPCWYALYTCPRHEKSVASQLAQRSLEFYLPVYRSIRRWNDRSRLLDMPLFPGYVFVHIPLREKLRVLSVNGAVRFVGVGTSPQALLDEDIEQIRQLLLAGKPMEPYPYMKTGSRVRVTRGPLEGAEGYVLRCKNACRIIVSVHLIQRSIAVELDFGDLGPLAAAPRPI